MDNGGKGVPGVERVTLEDAAAAVEMVAESEGTLMVAVLLAILD